MLNLKIWIAMNTEFLNDLTILPRNEFLNKYKNIKILTSTPVEADNTKSYIKVKDIDYYEIEFDKQGQWIELNANILRKLNPNITVEELTLGLLRIYHSVDWQTLYTAAVKSIALNQTVTPTKKKFKINRTFDEFVAVNVPSIERTRKGMADYYFEDIKDNINKKLTVEDNLSMMKSKGVRVSKESLLNACKLCGITLKTNKEVNDEKVIALIKKYPSKSDREIAELCKQNGLKAGKSTINTLRREIFG